MGFRMPSLAMLGIALTLAGGASAQSLGGNTINLLQDAIGSGDGGNTLTLDQSGAAGALLAGSSDGLLPALQIGGGNFADVTMRASDGQLLLSQTNTGTGPGSGNTLTALIEGNGFGQLAQTGQGNLADLVILSGAGISSIGGIEQIGLDNEARLTVRDGAAEGRIVQDGNYNRTELVVQGAGTVGTITQRGIGNGTGEPIQVISNGAIVHIIQGGV